MALLQMRRKTYKDKFDIKRALVLLLMITVLGFFYCSDGSKEKQDYATASVISISKAEAGAMVTDVKLRIQSGPLEGQIHKAPIMVDSSSSYSMELKKGDQVVVVSENIGGEWKIGIDEHYRTPKLIFLLIVVSLLLILIGRWQGILSFLALASTIILVFGGLTRLLLASYPPVPMAIAFSALITLLTLTLIGGLSQKTAIATLGTVGGASMAGLLGYLSAETMHLSGVTGHEALFLRSMSSSLDFRGLLLCAIIVGALGAVMDVCMSLATSLEEISRASKSTNFKSLFSSGMKMGSDLLGTMTNTLVLAYTGSSLTLILLLSAQKDDFPLIRLINMEFITVEIVRSLAGLFGMACAIPISAAIGAFLYSKRKRRPKRLGE